jgi:2-dehydro-3-deoxyphosphogluconate aldolase / (4S)-4-hydroxy-2-oxoglutarate aldolase
MTRFERIDVLSSMYDTGFVPIFYNADIDIAKNVASACVDGGAELLEFTNRGDHAIEVFCELEKYCRRNLPDLVLGVGTILDPHTAALYMAHGASFVVGPNLNPEVAKLCNRHKIAYVPGCATVSEISNAEELGCEIVKIFPTSEAVGPEFVKAILGPCPWTSIMPTRGLDCTEESLRPWFDAGVACVGLGTRLITKEIMELGDFKTLADRVAKVADIITDLISPPPPNIVTQPFNDIDIRGNQ